jgi:hypothetical protein
MKRRKVGKKYQLLVYQRAWDRLWKNMLVIGFLLAGVWVVAYFKMPFLDPIYDAVLFIGAMLVLAVALVSFLVRRLAYVQAYPDHIRFVTPLLQFKIPFQRIRSVRPTELGQIYSPHKAKAVERSLLEPYYGATVVVIELNAYPMKPGVLRFFLPDSMLLPKSPGFVLVVKDWMALITEIDSFQGTWRQARGQRPRSGYGVNPTTKK